jgi:DNA polymerase III delta subunit
MLYIYYGTDTGKARAKVRATVNALLAKNPDALNFRITDDTFAEYDFDELTQSQALFKNEYIAVFENILAGEHAEIFIDNLAALKDSKHLFFVLEEKLTAPVRKKLEKHSEQIQEFEKKEKMAEKFNVFALTDALGARDREKLWVMFHQAKQNGTSDEELHGLFFWMLKTMCIAQGARSPEEAGMKPYPFKKAKGFLRNYTEAQLKEHIAVLATLPQKSRRNGASLDIALERFILESV